MIHFLSPSASDQVCYQQVKDDLLLLSSLCSSESRRQSRTRSRAFSSSPRYQIQRFPKRWLHLYPVQDHRACMLILSRSVQKTLKALSIIQALRTLKEPGDSPPDPRPTKSVVPGNYWKSNVINKSDMCSLVTQFVT